jgi:hypothetical protein
VLQGEGRGCARVSRWDSTWGVYRVVVELVVVERVVVERVGFCDVVDVVVMRGRVSPPVVAIGTPPPVSVAVVPLVDDATGAVGACDVSVSAVLPVQLAQTVITAAIAMSFLMVIRNLLIDREQSSRPVGLTCENIRVEVLYG